MNSLTVQELCDGVAQRKVRALRMLRTCARPGTVWGRDDYRFGAVITGEMEPGKTRLTRFDADGFTGHTDVEDAPEYLIQVFGLDVKRMPAPTWMK